LFKKNESVYRWYVMHRRSLRLRFCAEDQIALNPSEVANYL